MSENHLNQRNLKIDILKGIGIIMMVFRHARGPYSDFVVLFHMAIFFIASGYLINSYALSNGKDLGQYIKRKLLGLWRPYFAFSCLFIICHNLFLCLHIYTDDPQFLNYAFLENTQLSKAMELNEVIVEIVKAVFFQANTQLGGAFWFFYELFVVLVLYNVIGFFLNKLVKTEKRVLILQGIVSILLLLVGYYCFLNNIALRGISGCLSAYCLVYIGFLIKRKKIMDKCCDAGWKIVCGVMVSFLILMMGYHKGDINIGINKIENPVFFLVMSLAGWNLIYFISYMLEKNNFIGNKCIVYLSRHSVWIIALHFLSFKLINLIQVKVYGYEPCCIAAFPVLHNSGAWWVLYTLVGLLLPLILETVCSKLYCSVKMQISEKAEKKKKSRL